VPELFVGTYSNAGGAGLYPLRRAAGVWSLGEPFAGAANASYGACSARRGVHYLLDEQREGMLGVFRHDRGAWQALARVPTGGREPCYAALSPDENWLAVANYGSGSLALFRLDDAGLTGEPVAVRPHSGHGPNAERQDGPPAHCAVISPDANWLYQPDLGTAEIRAFAYDPARGLTGVERTAGRAPAGSGPRHLVFHPRQPIALLVSELASSLTVLDVGDGTLTERQCISTLPDGFDGDSLGGHLALNAAGTRAYVTNRGHDSIAVFAVDGGTLSLIGHTPSGGPSPRFFALLEDQPTLLVAHEEGNSVGVFDVHDDGTLAQSAWVDVPGPAFIFAAG
jgi:6-phosphogluconolactonase